MQRPWAVAILHPRCVQGLQMVRALRQHGLARQIVDVAALLGEWRSAAQRYRLSAQCAINWQFAGLWPWIGSIWQ